MPKIRFSDLPRPLWRHLLDRVQERQVSVADLEALQAWVQSGPQAPEGDWYRDFGTFKLCGSGDRPKTVLTGDMKPYGEPID